MWAWKEYKITSKVFFFKNAFLTLTVRNGNYLFLISAQANPVLTGLTIMTIMELGSI